MYFRTINSRRFLIVCLSCIGLFATGVPLAANSEGTSEAELVEAMDARLPAVMELKLKGKIGETNKGLLEARASLERDQRRLVADENRDRLAHYKLIADELGLPVGAVQRKRAEQIRENTPRGIWIESSIGVWYRD